MNVSGCVLVYPYSELGSQTSVGKIKLVEYWLERANGALSTVLQILPKVSGSSTSYSAYRKRAASQS